MRVLERLLPEGRRGYVALLLAAAPLLPPAVLTRPEAGVWAWATDYVFVFFALYLLLYVVLTALAFTLVPRHRVSAWAAGTTPGTWVDHVLRGDRPGPGQAAMLSLVALVSVLAWHSAEPQAGWLDPVWRGAVSVVLLAAAWCAVLLTYAVAYLCQDARSGRRELVFPGDAEPVWGDYLYAAVGVSTTFGPTDVTVVTPAMRRTVMVHAVLAFFFNTVIIVTAITLLLR